MNQTRRKTVRRRSGVGTGTTSLLMIFTVLCFATLAMLSLSTAASNGRIQGRGLEGQRLLAAAKGSAAADVAGLDEMLLQLQLELQEETSQKQLEIVCDATVDPYYDRALAIADSRGWQTAWPDAIRMINPIDGTSQLVTTLRLLPPGGPRYEVTAQVSELINGWTPEPGGQLWLPGGDIEADGA